MSRTCDECEEADAKYHLIITDTKGEVIDDAWMCAECIKEELKDAGVNTSLFN